MNPGRHPGRVFGLLLGWAISTAALHAHGPLDSSATITVGADELEVTVTLGPDLAAKVFSEQLPDVPRPQPVGPGTKLPVKSVADLFRLAVAGQELAPLDFHVATDGLEYAFTARFPGSGVGDLQFRAAYFALSDRMPPSSLRVQTQSRQTLHQAVLSPAHALAEIPLPPAPASHPPAAMNAAAPVGGATNVPVVLTNELGGDESARSRNRFLPGLVLALGLLLAGGFLLARRRA